MRIQRTSRRVLLGIVTAAALTGSALVAPAGARPADSGAPRPPTGSSPSSTSGLLSAARTTTGAAGATPNLRSDAGRRTRLRGTRRRGRPAAGDPRRRSSAEPRTPTSAPGGTTYAGAIGKLLTAVQAQGIDPQTTPPVACSTRLRGGGRRERRRRAGTGQGRHGADADYSNTFAQAWSCAHSPSRGGQPEACRRHLVPAQAAVRRGLLPGAPGVHRLHLRRRHGRTRAAPTWTPPRSL